jgi:ABC-type uncharacterized transport system auxiliary subunit
VHRVVTLALGLVCGGLLLSGCALFRKSAPLDVRYFSPVSYDAPATRAEHPRAQFGLKLGEVLAAPHLRQRIVYRKDGHELNYYVNLRWTEPPEEYVRRELTRVLFEEAGVTRVVAGDAPTLEVELLSFEELLAPRHAARVVIKAALIDEQVQVFGRTFVSEKPIAENGTPAQMVDALARALHESVTLIAEEVMRRLRESAPPP